MFLFLLLKKINFLADKICSEREENIMFRGLYTAGSAMMSNTRRIDVVSNNLANIDTNSFKKDIILTETFEEVLISKRNGFHENNNFTTEGFEFTENNGIYSLNAPKAFIKIDGKREANYSKSAEVRVDEDGYLGVFYKDGNSNLYSDKGGKLHGQSGYIFVGDKELTFDQNGNVLIDGKIEDNILFVPNSNVIGTMSGGVRGERTETLFEQGQLERTDFQFDLSLDGEGFFQVETPKGNMFTRNGEFKLSADNVLVTSENFKVLGLNGPIVLEGDNIQVNDFGEIIVDGETIDKLQVVNIDNTYDLKKYGAGYFQLEDGYEVEESDFIGAVRQGYIEKSNANNLTEMITLLELYRNYESNQKMVSAYDKVLDKAVNQIGRL